MNAFMNFENMDRMIAYFNTMHGDRFNMMYSTPSMYIDAMNKLDINWPVKEDDLFPYQDEPASFWTGYFTSRPNAKSQVRAGSSAHHSSSQLFSAAMID
jgi:lysosomal alpha-mannosidase